MQLSITSTAASSQAFIPEQSSFLQPQQMVAAFGRLLDQTLTW